MSLMVTIKKESAWKFNTFGSGGASIGIFAANGGTVRLNEPNGALHSFYYGGVGAGASFGIKLPKIGKVQIETKKGPVTGTVGPTPFPSKGQLYVTENFSGEELSTSNIRGLCAFIDVGGGLLIGYSGVAMLLNLNPLWLAAAPGSPIAMQLFLGSADAVLMMSGPNVGVQAGIGGAVFLGALV